MPGINSTQSSSLRQTSSPSLRLSLRLPLRLSLCSLQIEGSRWKIGDDVAVLYSGDYYVAKIMKVMKRKSGDMYEVKYSDGSKSVVGEDKVKDIVK